jgi:dihydrofolate synthase/folylpolyglutamate synthase
MLKWGGERIMNYQEALDYIYGHTNYEAVPKPHAEDNYDLRRLYEVLDRLGNPHLKAKSLHIAGTNGKGSTSAMLASVLSAAGYTTGLYTSPHLVTSRERFEINGRLISEETLADITCRIQPEIEAVSREGKYGQLTVFEILTVLSFVWFAESRCEIQVMEVGMGGRFDATNVIQPAVCFITSISLDHTAILGDTVAKIALEKCGIIKPGCTVISHPQVPAADSVIQQTCREKGVKLIRVGQDVTRRSLDFDFEHQVIEIRGRLDTYRVSIPLLGQYQLDNTAAAMAGLEVLLEKGYRISPDNILKGLTEVKFPGRMNIISRQPLIVVDGGHNPGAAHNLKEALNEYFQPAKSILVIGISSDKDIPGIVKELAPIFNVVIATRANSPRSAPPAVIAAEFAKQGIIAAINETVAGALAQAKTLAGPEDLICVTGSLYVVGEAIESVQGYAGSH